MSARRVDVAAAMRIVGDNPPGTPDERHPEELYSTGPAATLALLAVERFPGAVWEPACGRGAMAKVLRSPAGAAAGIERVAATDLHDHGYGGARLDFLAPGSELGVESLFGRRIDHVVTNPPFKGRLPERFLARALEVADRKVALVLRLQWLEGAGRHARVFARTPPSRIWVSPWRFPMARGGERMRAGLMSFAWMVWDRDYRGRTELDWLPGPNF